jgi:hypothetical protein
VKKKKTTVENVAIEDLFNLLNSFKADGYRFVNLENNPDDGILYMYGVKKENEPVGPKKQLPSSSDDIDLLLNNS